MLLFANHHFSSWKPREREQFDRVIHTRCCPCVSQENLDAMQCFGSLRDLHDEIRIFTVICSRLRETSGFLRKNGERVSTSTARTVWMVDREQFGGREREHGVSTKAFNWKIRHRFTRGTGLSVQSPDGATAKGARRDFDQVSKNYLVIPAWTKGLQNLQ